MWIRKSVLNYRFHSYVSSIYTIYCWIHYPYAWTSLILCLYYISVDWLYFLGKLHSYQLFITHHIITDELPTIGELSVQFENLMLISECNNIQFLGLIYNVQFILCDKWWHNEIHSASVLRQDVEAPSNSFCDRKKATALDSTHLYHSCMQHMKQLCQCANNKSTDEEESQINVQSLVCFSEATTSFSCRIILHLLFHFPFQEKPSEIASSTKKPIIFLVLHTSNDLFYMKNQFFFLKKK